MINYYCLPHVSQIHPSGDLLDQNGGQSMGPQFLVNAQEVDLGHLVELPFDRYVEGNRSNHGHDFLCLFHLDTDKPIGDIIRWTKSPLQKLNGVIEAEHSIIVF